MFYKRLWPLSGISQQGRMLAYITGLALLVVNSIRRLRSYFRSLSFLLGNCLRIPVNFPLIYRSDLLPSYNTYLFRNPSLTDPVPLKISFICPWSSTTDSLQIPLQIPSKNQFGFTSNNFQFNPKIFKGLLCVSISHYFSRVSQVKELHVGTNQSWELNCHVEPKTSPPCLF